jgi:hypothetical protein
MATKKDTGKKSKGDRELIDTGTDKRYVRRDEKGQFKESDDVGHSLAQDVKRHAKTEISPAQGDRGDAKVGKYTLSSGRGNRDRPRVGRRCLTEDEVERLLEAQGAIRLPSVPPSPAPRPAPIDVPGKPVSETIIEERR